MRNHGRRDYEHGRIVEVTVATYGSELSGDTSAGATTLVVEDAADFDEDGGTLVINDQVIVYESMDDDTGTITLASALAVDADEGDRVNLYDPLYGIVTTDKVAQVKVDGDNNDADPLEASIAMHLVDRLEEGIRGVTGESVLLELDGDEWRVIDVLGFGDPDANGPASGTKFYQDHHTILVSGDQEIQLTFLPILHSEHVYWNGVYQRGVNWSRSGQVITMTDPDEIMEVDDNVTVEYAYRQGITTDIVPANETPVGPVPASDPIIYDGTGTGGGILVGSGGVWSDANLATGVELHAVDNALGRDAATIRLDSNTGLGIDPTGFTIFCDLTFTIVDYIDIRVQLCEAEDLSYPVPFMAGVYSGVGGAVSIELSGDLDHFLGRMDADLPVWVRVTIDSTAAPVGFDEVFVSELRVRIAEVDE